jgi:hypothetical protein
MEKTGLTKLAQIAEALNLRGIKTLFVLKRPDSFQGGKVLAPRRREPIGRPI